MENLKTIDKLIEILTYLPTIGPKNAERLAYSFLNMNTNNIDELINILKNIKSNIHKCNICGLYTEKEQCDICSDKEREHDTIIVVSFSQDVQKFEQTKIYNGVYHVLHGMIDVSKKIGIDNLNTNSLIKRIEQTKIKEIIIATDCTQQGEITAKYLNKLLQNKNIKITRIAYGLPLGGHLDYADSFTIGKSLEGRKQID